MISEIGAAQQRLFNDDDASSAAQHLPSTATPYPSEISQPGSFPTMQSFHLQTGDANNNIAGLQAPHNAPYEATQLIAPIQAQAYGYDTPATSNHVDSPLGDAAQATDVPIVIPLNDGTHANPSQKTVQRTKSMQNEIYSPHDTEPLSSATSPRLNRSKSDNGMPGMMSPQHSQESAHDELSAPAVAVEISTVKKKRGRPKKQAMPEIDEDDELSLSRGHESDQTNSTEKRRPGRPPKSVVEVNEDTEPAKDADPLSMAPGPDTTLPQEPEQPAPIPPKKKKVKRGKTDSAVLQKPQNPDDDVIWVDSRPLDIKEDEGKTEPRKEIKSTSRTDTASALPDDSKAEATQPALKKRGRKRKTPAEQPAEQSAPKAASGPEELNTPQEPQAPVPNTVAESSIETKNRVPENESSNHQDAQEPQDQLPQPDSTTHQNGAHPETPQKPAAAVSTSNQSTTKKPGPSPFSSTGKVPYRVGLSRRARIAPLLKVVRK